MAAAAPGSPRWTGRCLCGAVTFTATPNGGMHACHCSTCRRQSGGILFSVDCGDSVAVTGEVATYVSSDWATRQFCPACGTGLFWRSNDGAITNLTVRPGDTANANVPIIGIVDAHAWRIMANYKQDYIRSFTVGGEAWVWLDSQPFHFHRARIQGIARGFSREVGVEGWKVRG